MGLSYKVNELPETLREGEFAVVNGAVFTGNSNNEPVPVGAAEPAPVLAELPEADAEKVGEQFWYNGTLWTYAKEGQFGSLVEGTPWPVKGYKEISGVIDVGEDLRIASEGAGSVVAVSLEDIANSVGVTNPPASLGRLKSDYLNSEIGFGFEDEAFNNAVFLAVKNKSVSPLKYYMTLSQIYLAPNSIVNNGGVEPLSDETAVLQFEFHEPNFDGFSFFKLNGVTFDYDDNNIIPVFRRIVIDYREYPPSD